MEEVFQKTWVEISARAVRHNITTLRSFLRPTTQFFAAVKSNAYGHGLVPFARLAHDAGVDGFCVDSIEEGVTLRRHGIKEPILILGATFQEMWPLAKKYNCMITISNEVMLKSFLRHGKGVLFHIKIDTGMHRQGFYVTQIPFVIRTLTSSIFLKNQCKGVYTRFAAESDARTEKYTLHQIKVFESARTLFQNNGFSQILFHAAGTGGIALYPEAHYDMVRAGIGIYGYWPSLKINISYGTRKGCRVKLDPVLAWKTRVSEVKCFAPGDYIGYDNTVRVTKKTKGAILPIGYWHGFPRSLSQKGIVIVRGEYAKILGYISMDMTTLQLSRVSQVMVGDVVTLIGRDGGKVLDAQEVATRADMIHYELLTTINPYIPRHIVL